MEAAKPDGKPTFGRIDAALALTILTGVVMYGVTNFLSADERNANKSLANHDSQQQAIDAVRADLGLQIKSLSDRFEREREVSDELSQKVTKLEQDLQGARTEARKDKEMYEEKLASLRRDHGRLEQQVAGITGYMTDMNMLEMLLEKLEKRGGD